MVYLTLYLGLIVRKRVGKFRNYADKKSDYSERGLALEGFKETLIPQTHRSHKV